MIDDRLSSLDVARLVATVEQITELVMITDPHGVIAYVNPYAEQVLGYPSKELLGENISSLVTGLQDPAFFESLRHKLKAGEIWKGLLVDRRKDGSLLTQETGLYSIQDADGKLLGYATVQRDVSEHERDKEQLSKQLSESQALFEISQTLAGMIDLPATLQQIADAAAALIKTSSRTILHLLDAGGSYLHAVAVSGVDRPAPEHRLNFRAGEGIAGLALSTGQTINVTDISTDERYLAVDGAAPALRSLLVAPVKTGARSLGTLSVQSQTPAAFTPDDERLLTTLGAQAAVAIEKAQLYADLHTSLDHEKAARVQLVQAEKLAALGRIVASVAHELNNPMQAIQNALYLIGMEETLTPQAHQDLQTVLSEVDRMADLIARLRETYRPVEKEEFQPVSLNLLVAEVQKLLATHLRRNQVAFDFHLDPALPDIPLIRDQLKQVILNICLNAVEMMPDGGCLTLHTLSDPATAGVTLTIADTGPGISPKILPYIFDPFVTTKDGGTGLGLSISYDIIQRHNGQINVETEVGQGARFKVWLPVRQGFEAFPDQAPGIPKSIVLHSE